jgi:hypothetical protein
MGFSVVEVAMPVPRHFEQWLETGWRRDGFLVPVPEARKLNACWRDGRLPAGGAIAPCGWNGASPSSGLA